MEHLSSENEDHPNQQENSHKLCDETGHLILSLAESQYKQTTSWSEIPNGKDVVEEVPALVEINKSRRAGLWES